MAAQRNVDTVTYLPHQQPRREQQPDQVVTRRVRRRRKRSLYSIKLLLALCGMGVFALMFMQLYWDSQINHLNSQAEVTRLEINRALLINEQLASQVSELSRPTRIIDIAIENGLIISENVIRIQR
ncbi:MAG: hypothetical protein FWE07_08675 [Turicibacter sp.]|nr:hypothetical protein [Turicibacter sp.]